MKKKLVVSLFLIFLLGMSSTKVAAKSNAAPVKVTFWHAMNGPYKAALDDIITDFNESHPEYQVEGTSQGSYSALQQKLTAAAKAKTMPTIAQTVYTSVPDFQSAGMLQQLDPYMNHGKNALTKKDRKDIYPVFMDSSKYQGHYYSMPFSKSLRVMYVNQDLLKKYHLKQPTSWEAMQKISKKLKKHDIYTVGLDKSFDIEYDMLIHQLGVRQITKKGKVNIDSKASLQAAHVITDMLKAGTAKTAGADKYFTNGFIQGKSLLYIGSSAGMTQIQQQAPKDFHWTAVPVPSYHGKQTTEVAGNDLVMLSGAKKQQQKGAWAFMKYLTSRQVTAKWAAETNYVPVRRSAVKEKVYQNYLKKNPEAKAAAESLPNAFTGVAFKGSNEYQLEMWNAVDSMVTKGTSPEKAFKKLAKQAKTIIADHQ